MRTHIGLGFMNEQVWESHHDGHCAFGLWCRRWRPLGPATERCIHVLAKQRSCSFKDHTRKVQIHHHVRCVLYGQTLLQILQWSTWNATPRHQTPNSQSTTPSTAGLSTIGVRIQTEPICSAAPVVCWTRCVSCARQLRVICRLLMQTLGTRAPTRSNISHWIGHASKEREQEKKRKGETGVWINQTIMIDAPRLIRCTVQSYHQASVWIF